MYFHNVSDYGSPQFPMLRRFLQYYTIIFILHALPSIYVSSLGKLLDVSLYNLLPSLYLLGIKYSRFTFLNVSQKFLIFYMFGPYYLHHKSVEHISVALSFLFMSEEIV